MVRGKAEAGGKMITQENVKTHYERLLFYYDLTPKKIEQYGKTGKITTNRGAFALKETTLSTEQLSWYHHVIERINSLRFPYIPLIKNKYGDFFNHSQGHIYYLMPWITEEENVTKLKRTEALVHLTATLHHLTVKEQDYSEEMIVSSQELLSERWTDQQNEFEAFASMAEHKTYQSPFELQFLSHFNLLMARVDQAKNHLISWREACKETQKLRSVLCHGKLSPTHTVMGQNGPALINFEKAVLDTPVRDLAILLRRACLYLSLEKDQWFHLLHSYEAVFPLDKEEKILLMSYLNYPEPFYNLLLQYKDEGDNANELTFVQRFENQLIQFNQMNSIIDYLSEDLQASSQEEQSNTDTFSQEDDEEDMTTDYEK